MDLDGEGGGGMGGGGEDGNASGCGGLLVRMGGEVAEGVGVFFCFLCLFFFPQGLRFSWRSKPVVFVNWNYV